VNSAHCHIRRWQQYIACTWRTLKSRCNFSQKIESTVVATVVGGEMFAPLGTSQQQQVCTCAHYCDCQWGGVCAGVSCLSRARQDNHKTPRSSSPPGSLPASSMSASLSGSPAALWVKTAPRATRTRTLFDMKGIGQLHIHSFSKCLQCTIARPVTGNALCRDVC
jgi:hypothetical protein